MAVQASVKDAFTFVGGLNTEGGYFIIPENTYKEGVNVIPQMDGTIERRTAIDYETNYSLYAAGISADNKNLYAFTTGEWHTVGGNGNLDFIVVQLGNMLHFYNASTGSISGSKKSFTVNLNSYKQTGNTELNGTALCSFTTAYGRLIVTSKNTKPILITYTASTDSISVSEITINIRDFKGKPLVTSGGVTVAIDAEYTSTEWANLGISLSDVTYNLYNQGWTDSQINTYKSANSNKYPSNTKSWVFGKDSNDNFDASILNKQDFGNSPAPKGHYILNPFDNVNYSFKTCAFFAGRAWYSGVPETSLLGTVFFSQVLDDFKKIGNCYQTNDPTSEVLSDLEDDDGGTIEIPDAGEITAIQSIGRGVMVFATNGVWLISNIDQGFTAASYTVSQVTNIGCLNNKSIVLVEDTIIYWSSSGIYAIASPNGVDYSAKNISEIAIKSFYQNIPILGKLYAEGAYNGTSKVIYWLYSSTTTTSTSEGRFNKNTILAFDVRLNSWYWFSLDSSVGVIPVSIQQTKETNSAGENYSIIAGVDDVISGSDSVIATIPTLRGTEKVFKVLTLHPVTSNNYSATFADFINERENTTRFKDWYQFNNVGVEVPAYFITGYNMGSNGPARTKTGQYLTVFMKRTETAFDANAIPLNQSGCLMQSRWDFTDNAFTGKWADDVQVYRQLRPYFASPSSSFDDGYPLVISKNKLRGRGKAVQFKFTSQTGKDMKIVGWSGTFVGSTNV